MLTADVADAARRSVLCWLATVDEQGQPNVSPKEIFALSGAHNLVIANVASPTSVRNIQRNPRVCVSFVDVFVQKGFKVSGLARNLGRADPDYGKWVELLLPLAGTRFRIGSVIVVDVTAVEAIVAPSYRFYPDETTEQSQVDAAMKTYGVRPVSAKGEARQP